MNEASTAANAMQEVATSSVIMTEVIIYAVASIVILLLMDLYAAKSIGDKTSMEYKILRIPRYVALFIICGFTVAIGILCMYNEDFSVTRSTLTYFGVPYFLFKHTPTPKKPLPPGPDPPAAFVWCLALPKDFISGSAGYGVGLVHDGVLARRCPHPTRLRRPTFPLGEGSANAVQACNVVPSYDI